MQEFIDLAHELADESGHIIRQYYRQPFDVENKSDESPVTIADKSVEKRLRKIVESKRPDDGIIGEEYGEKPSKNQYTWVFDPIDGTKSFVIGRPTFGTLIALCKEGVPILGIIDQPILKERWLGVEGHPTLYNSEKVQTSSCKDISQARIASTGPYMFPNHWQSISQCGQFIVWGGDCYSFGLMANGNIDIIVEGKLSFYDFAALLPVVNGAGGWIGDWDGNTLQKGSDGMVVALGDISIKEQILDILK